MNITTATLVAVLGRAVRAVERPLLFHEVKTPARAAARLARLERWAGPLGRAVALDCLRRRDPGQGGTVTWRRAGAGA